MLDYIVKCIFLESMCIHFNRFVVLEQTHRNTTLIIQMYKSFIRKNYELKKMIRGNIFEYQPKFILSKILEAFGAKLKTNFI